MPPPKLLGRARRGLNNSHRMTAVLVPNRPGNTGGYQQLASDKLAMGDVEDLGPFDFKEADLDDELLPDRLRRKMVT